MKDLDRYIKTLYLASSPVREEMLESLIENALYTWNEPASFDEIISVIEEAFSFQPIKDEVNDCLLNLEDKKVIFKGTSKWYLSEDSKKDILNRELGSKDREKERLENFEKMLKSLTQVEIQEPLKIKLWEKYNRYLIECFRIYAQDAVKMFLPYSADFENEDKNSKLYQSYLSKFKGKEEKSLFEKVVSNYPSHISKADLQYLDNLADRTESFFSLGLPKEDYDQATNLKLLGWTLVADTNFLYSVLDLRPNNENDASNELVKLAKENIVDIKIVYLPETLKELKKLALTQILPTNYTPSQIRALLESNKLDPLARHYYEKKKRDHNTPHPSHLIDQALFILKNKGITIFNSQEIKNILEDEEYEKYLVTQYILYADYERMRNNLRIEKGLPEKDTKSTSKIEHDILLREGIFTIRKGALDINEIKHYGLTLDETLINFDNFIIKRESKGINHVPTFFKPSILLRRLRSFIPIVTNDYEKAFLQAITSRTHDTKKSFSLAAQRSVAYFNSLGIDDKDIMLACISDEIFLKQFEEWENKGEGGIFIESELHKRIEKLNKEKVDLEKQSSEQIKKKEEQISKIQERNALTKQDLLKVLEEKEEVTREAKRQEEEKLTALQEKEETNQKILKFEEQLLKEKQLRIKNQALLNYEKAINTYNNKKAESVNLAWQEEKAQAKSGLNNFFRFFIILFVVIVLSEILKGWILSNGTLAIPAFFKEFSTLISSGSTLLVTTAFYIIDYFTGRQLWEKHKTSIGKAVDYYLNFNKKSLKEKKDSEAIENFIKQNPEPKLAEIEAALLD